MNIPNWVHRLILSVLSTLCCYAVVSLFTELTFIPYLFVELVVILFSKLYIFVVFKFNFVDLPKSDNNN